MGDVTLLDELFKNARDPNIQILLKYNVDRLLARYRKETWLTAKASSYPNWIGLDRHIGRYLYGGGFASYPLAVSRGKELWITEHVHEGSSSDEWTYAFGATKEINDCIEVGMRAYVWWYNKHSISQTFTIQSGSVASFTPYVTSMNKDCVRESDITVTNGTFTATFDLLSLELSCQTEIRVIH